MSWYAHDILEKTVYCVNVHSWVYLSASLSCLACYRDYISVYNNLGEHILRVLAPITVS